MSDILYKNEVYKLIGHCMSVYNELGDGFLEEVYQEALEREFQQYGVPYAREVPLTISYKGRPLEKKYFADFVCYGKIIIECKAVAKLVAAHAAQTVNYLRATGYKLALLVNFNNPEELEWSRIVNTRSGRKSDKSTLAEIQSISGDSRIEAN